MLGKKTGRKQLLRVPANSVGRHNSTRVDEGRKSWNLLAIKMQGTNLSGQGSGQGGRRASLLYVNGAFFMTSPWYAYVDVILCIYVCIWILCTLYLLSSHQTSNRAFYPMTSFAVHPVSVLIHKIWEKSNTSYNLFVWSDSSETEKKRKSRMNQGRQISKVLTYMVREARPTVLS